MTTTETTETPFQRSPKAQLVNDAITHLQTVVKRLNIQEQETPGAAYMLAAQREPLAALLERLLPLRTPLALLPDGNLACGQCGNTDREEMEVCEYVLRTWSLPEHKEADDTDEASFKIDGGTDTVVWEADYDGERLYCKLCGTESLIPSHIGIEWE